MRNINIDSIIEELCVINMQQYLYLDDSDYIRQILKNINDEDVDILFSINKDMSCDGSNDITYPTFLLSELHLGNNSKIVFDKIVNHYKLTPNDLLISARCNVQGLTHINTKVANDAIDAGASVNEENGYSKILKCALDVQRFLSETGRDIYGIDSFEVNALIERLKKLGANEYTAEQRKIDYRVKKAEEDKQRARWHAENLAQTEDA